MEEKVEARVKVRVTGEGRRVKVVLALLLFFPNSRERILILIRAAYITPAM